MGGKWYMFTPHNCCFGSICEKPFYREVVDLVLTTYQYSNLLSVLALTTPIMDLSDVPRLDPGMS